jgi:ribosomal protein S18 acetylase RimI-like enzyme
LETTDVSTPDQTVAILPGTRMHALTLRTEVRCGDRQHVAEITAATQMFHPPEVAVAVELVDDRLTRGAASDYQFLFVDEGTATLGYAIFGFNSMTRSGWDLYWIAVHPECHGSGVGRLLLGEVESRARAQGCTHLWVDTAGRENYKPTRAFYVAMGYTIAAELKDFYAPGDSKIVFVKVLG